MARARWSCAVLSFDGQLRGKKRKAGGSVLAQGPIRAVIAHSAARDLARRVSQTRPRLWVRDEGAARLSAVEEKFWSDLTLSQYLICLKGIVSREGLHRDETLSLMKEVLGVSIISPLLQYWIHGVTASKGV